MIENEEVQKDDKIDEEITIKEENKENNDEENKKLLIENENDKLKEDAILNNENNENIISTNSNNNNTINNNTQNNNNNKNMIIGDYYITIQYTKFLRIPYFKFGNIIHFYCPFYKFKAPKIALSKMPNPPFGIIKKECKSIYIYFFNFKYII